jgi:hypothetical protein
MHGLRVGDREAHADCQCGELIDRIAAGAPVRELLFVEALGDTWVPFAGYRPDHRAGVELGTIDAHRAAEAAADLERRLDDRVAREARRDRFEIGDFAGWAAAGHSVPPRSRSGGQRPQFDADKTVRLDVVIDPADDNRLRFGPACRALDVSPSSTRSRPGVRCFAITE